MNKRSSRNWRALLSIAVVFHLLAIVFGPNRLSYLSSRLDFALKPYGNLIQTNAGWDFFAPDPGSPMSLEWDLLDERGESMSKGHWPDLEKRRFWVDPEFRRTCAARFMTSAPGRAERMMGPWLCRTNPQATSVMLWSVVRPALAVIPGSSLETDRATASSRDIRKSIGHYFCEGRNG